MTSSSTQSSLCPPGPTEMMETHIKQTWVGQFPAGRFPNIRKSPIQRDTVAYNQIELKIFIIQELQ